jgi:hypothetical protein
MRTSALDATGFFSPNAVIVISAGGPGKSTGIRIGESATEKATAIQIMLMVFLAVDDFLINGRRMIDALNITINNK